MNGMNGRKEMAGGSRIFSPAAVAPSRRRGAAVQATSFPLLAKDLPAPRERDCATDMEINDNNTWIIASRRQVLMQQ